MNTHLKGRHFISIRDWNKEELETLVEFGYDLKKRHALGEPQRLLEGKTLAMIFADDSLRHRVSFEAGITQLGGHGQFLDPVKLHLVHSKEPWHDTIHVMSRYVDGIMIRTFAHQEVIDLARAAKIPVINALTDLLHPCQAMADFFTLKEKHKNFTSLKLAYVGDGNNVCHSLLYAAAKAGCQIRIATPSGFEPDAAIVKQAEEDATETGASFFLTNDPSEAVEDSDAVYTDVWASMGQEEEKKDRAKIFASFQVNSELMAKAKADALFMHCLPAHRGEEVTDEVIDSPQSVVFDQAENRLHIQKIIMLLLMEKKQK